MWKYFSGDSTISVYYLTTAKYSRKHSRGTLKNCEYCESFAQQTFSKQTRCIKSSNLRKEVGITIKSEETSSQLKPVRNSYVAIKDD